MAEQNGYERDRGPSAPQNPPRSVVNRNVRRTALWTYLAPLVLFFLGVGAVLLYWGSSPPAPDRVGDPTVTGTSGTDRGTEREPPREDSPGGQNPDERPRGPAEETKMRGAAALTELGDVAENDGRGQIGRRVELRDMDVERVDAPGVFWIRDGKWSVMVAAAEGAADVKAGQTVDVVGRVERSGDSVRIRASRVTPNDARDRPSGT